MGLFELFDPSDVAAAEPARIRSRRREDVPDRFKWNLADIFPSWEAWEAGYKQLEADIALAGGERQGVLTGRAQESGERDHAHRMHTSSAFQGHL